MFVICLFCEDIKNVTVCHESHQFRFICKEDANIHFNLRVSASSGETTSVIGGLLGDGSLFTYVVPANPLLMEFFRDGKREIFLSLLEVCRCI